MLLTGAVTATEVEREFSDLFHKLYNTAVLQAGANTNVADNILFGWDDHCNQDENEKALLEALEECLKG